MLPAINTVSGFLVFVALCFGGVAGGLYVRSSRLSAHSCTVVNKAELRIFRILQQTCSTILGPRFHVLAQVSYGEFLSSSNRSLFLRFNCKRADFLIMDNHANPVAVLEYQGSGHFGYSLVSKIKALKSDRIKRKILKRAGIPMYEIGEKFDVDDLSSFFCSLNHPHSKSCLIGA